MLNRRRLLQSGGIATAAMLATRSAHAKAKETCLPSPPSIAALKSLKDQATPISASERRERQEKARHLMRANNLDCIFMAEGTSLEYFSGIRWHSSERLLAMVLPAKGAAFYVCPGFEEGRAREQLAKAPDGKGADVRIWQEDESPYERVAQGLKDRGLSTGTLGMEEAVRFVFREGVAQAAPQATIAGATPVTAGCRRIKSEHEISLMRLAAKATLTAYEAGYRAVKEGMTKPEFEDLIEAAHKQLGFDGGADAEVGEYSAFPHGSVTPQVIREGTIVLIDGGCRVEGYSSDITRTFVVGKPTEKMKKVFEVVHLAQSTALKTARPGVECQAVDAVARKVIADAGFGPDYKFFTHRVGHGMGMDVHEWPYLVHGNTTKLESNMTFSDEPGLYIRGEFGVRLEDDMHITENGAELFTSQSHSLEEPFGKG
jgi:Xaa-Pro dipeptidase